MMFNGDFNIVGFKVFFLIKSNRNHYHGYLNSKNHDLSVIFPDARGYMVGGFCIFCPLKGWVTYIVVQVHLNMGNSPLVNGNVMGEF